MAVFAVGDEGRLAEGDHDGNDRILFNTSTFFFLL